MKTFLPVAKAVTILTVGDGNFGPIIFVDNIFTIVTIINIVILLLKSLLLLLSLLEIVIVLLYFFHIVILPTIEM